MPSTVCGLPVSTDASPRRYDRRCPHCNARCPKILGWLTSATLTWCMACAVPVVHCGAGIFRRPTAEDVERLAVGPAWRVWLSEWSDYRRAIVDHIARN